MVARYDASPPGVELDENCGALLDPGKDTILYTKSGDNLVWILYKLEDLLLLMMVFGLRCGMFLLLAVVS